VQLGVSGATYAVGRIGDQPNTQAAALDLIRAQLITEGIVETLKFATRRERPDFSNRRSFPSGHAAISVATATVLERRFGWASLPMYLIASYVTMSRLTADRHHLSDLVAGALIGVIVARTVTREARDAMSPVLDQKHRVDIAFTWTVPL